MIIYFIWTYKATILLVYNFKLYFSNYLWYWVLFATFIRLLSWNWYLKFLRLAVTSFVCVCVCLFYVVFIHVNWQKSLAVGFTVRPLSHRKYPMIVDLFFLRYLFCFSNLHVNHKPLHLLWCRRLACLFSYRKHFHIFLPSVENTWMFFADLFIYCLYSVCKIDSFIYVASVCIWTSEENFWSMLSLLPCSYGDWTQVLGRGSKQLFLLSHLTNVDLDSLETRLSMQI